MEIEEVLITLDSIEFIEREKVIDVIKGLRFQGQQDEVLDIFQISLDYPIYGSELRCKVSYPVENGYYAYPNESYYVDERRALLKSIVNSSKVSIINAHFGHLLVNLGEKHNNIRNKSIQGYYELIDLIKTSIETESDTKLKRKLNDYLFTYIFNIGYLLLKRDQKYTALVLELIQRKDLELLPVRLINYAISDSKNFKKSDFDGLDEIIYTYGIAQKKGWPKIYQFQIGVKLDKRCARKTKDWNYLMAQEYEYMTEVRNDLAVIEFANKASKLYQQSGYDEDAKRMANKYRDSADSRQFETIRNSIDITEQVQANLKVIKKLVKQSYVDILDNLRVSNQIIPTKSQMVGRAIAILEGDVFLNTVVALSIYDSNSNIAQSFHTFGQKIDYYMHEATYDYLKMTYHVWLGHLFGHLNEEAYWNSENVIDYFENHLWYGDESIKHLGSGDSINFRFIDLLSPGIKAYFDEIEKYKAERSYIFNFQLALDSLTLRIEGILRNIASINGIQTHYPKEDENGIYISKEKDINMLLANNEAELIAILGEDLHLFLVHLLIHKKGSNLRNEIAHSFLIPQNYCNFKIMNEVLIAIIRLGDKRMMPSKKAE